MRSVVSTLCRSNVRTHELQEWFTEKKSFVSFRGLLGMKKRVASRFFVVFVVVVFCFVKQILLSVTVYDLVTAKLTQRVFLTNALAPGERQFRLLTYES